METDHFHTLRQFAKRPLLARGRDRLETVSLNQHEEQVDNPLLARGRDRLETLVSDAQYSKTSESPLLARGRDRLET